MRLTSSVTLVDVVCSFTPLADSLRTSARCIAVLAAQPQQPTLSHPVLAPEMTTRTMSARALGSTEVLRVASALVGHSSVLDMGLPPSSRAAATASQTVLQR